jgi:hypothetical protein
LLLEIRSHLPADEDAPAEVMSPKPEARKHAASSDFDFTLWDAPEAVGLPCKPNVTHTSARISERSSAGPAELEDLGHCLEGEAHLRSITANMLITADVLSPNEQDKQIVKLRAVKRSTKEPVPMATAGDMALHPKKKTWPGSAAR